MKYNELETKWATATIREVPLEVWIQGKKHKCTLPSIVCNAPLGDFIREYILHLLIRRWWWKGQDIDWELTEKRMREILNQATIEWV